ncbi:MAG: serine/threonine protein kinase [Betaproteobacteria bacterium]|nr:serine/threonine protein kinase [Betaproteobacteria bacterium]
MGAGVQKRESATLTVNVLTVETRKLGRYQIVSEIGQGAMGTVYKAVDPLLDRTVALKTIGIAANDPDLAEYEARFYLEAKAVGGLNHPNIVTVHDVGNSGSMPYLAMEFVEGTELSALTGEGNPLPVEQVLNIGVQVADGLAYAHAHGVIHRDIKPANILLARDGVAKIADFGIARMRSAEARNETSNVMGSPRYMSPEQVLGRRADHRSDIFSLGVMLYEMLTGAPPFAGADLNAILFQIVNLVAPAPSSVNPAVPTMLDFIVAKALAKSPDERYGSSRELADDLQQCRANLGAAPRVASIAMPPQRILPKIDPYAATPLLAKSYPDARHGDSQKTDKDDATLGIARDFDSLAAMVRLAAQTGVAQNFENLVKAQESEAAEAATVYGTLVREQSSGIVSGLDRRFGRWSRADRLLFGACVAIAVVIGVIIALT